MNRRKSLLVAVVALLACGALVLFLRLPALPQAVIDWDESVYLLMARSMLQGHVPYTVVWDHKPPGLYVLFALAQLLFGQSVLAIRLLAVAAVTVSCWLLLLYGRRVLGSWAIGGLAALFYARLLAAKRRPGQQRRDSCWRPSSSARSCCWAWRTGVPATIQPGRRGSFLAIGLLLGAAIQIKAVAAAGAAGCAAAAGSGAAGEPPARIRQRPERPRWRRPAWLRWARCCRCWRWQATLQPAATSPSTSTPTSPLTSSTPAVRSSPGAQVSQALLPRRAARPAALGRRGGRGRAGLD